MDSNGGVTKDNLWISGLNNDPVVYKSNVERQVCVMTATKETTIPEFSIRYAKEVVTPNSNLSVDG
jgi:hypothetical protein